MKDFLRRGLLHITYFVIGYFMGAIMILTLSDSHTYIFICIIAFIIGWKTGDIVKWVNR